MENGLLPGQPARLVPPFATQYSCDERVESSVVKEVKKVPDLGHADTAGAASREGESNHHTRRES